MRPSSDSGSANPSSSVSPSSFGSGAKLKQAKGSSPAVKLGKSASRSPPPSSIAWMGSVSGCGSAESNCEWGSTRKTVTSSADEQECHLEVWQGETSLPISITSSSSTPCGLRMKEKTRSQTATLSPSSPFRQRGTSDHRCGRVKTFDKIVWRRCSERDSRSIDGRSDAGFRKTRAALHSSEWIE